MKYVLCLVLLLLPATLQAQHEALRVAEGQGAPQSVALAMHRGYPAYPAAALAGIGARIIEAPTGARIVIGGDTLVFQLYSPFFMVGGKARQLAAPVYREGGVLYLPHQFLTEWLPASYPDRYRFDGGVLRYTPVPTAEVVASRDGDGVAVSRTDPADATPQKRQAEPPPRVVIIDAGHGGRDPGKTGPNGLKEKDVTLAVAKRLAEILRGRDGYEVHLTRTTDTLIALADRPRLANQWKAGRPSALFISIHANAHGSQARGYETFFLSEARTEDERRVAEMENAAVEFEEDRVAATDDDLDWILNHLRNDFYLRASHDLAEIVQKRIGAIHPGPNRGVKQAGFRVLVGAFMPAVLVEMAFITHREESRLLASTSFQQEIARALAEAVEDFFASHEHLWLAADGD